MRLKIIIPKNNFRKFYEGDMESMKYTLKDILSKFRGKYEYSEEKYLELIEDEIEKKFKNKEINTTIPNPVKNNEDYEIQHHFKIDKEGRLLHRYRREENNFSDYKVIY
jgi:hypothetical protein